MFKKTLLFLFITTLVFLGFTVKPVKAEMQKNVVIVNPIRGKDFWSNTYSILDTPTKQYELLSKNNLPATWLIRYDALNDPQVISFLKTLNPDQEIGLFLEITPSLTKDAQVKYNQSPNWHYAKSVLLTGYPVSDRQKLIDTAVLKYRQIFNKNPKSVGAWWIDAGSLEYLYNKYQIQTNLDVADQFSTDQYQVWGQYWSTPFYPSRVNALMPAQSDEWKIGIVTIQWATRDPFNAFGNGVYNSTYSVQANDYLLHDLNIDYFEKLLNVYPQTTVGLENDFSWQKYGPEYTNQINLISQKKQAGQLTVKNMQSFANFYQTSYPKTSPNILLVSDDPLGTSGKVVWFQTPKYRVGWFYNKDGSVIRDLRILNDSKEEVCLKTACDNLKLAFNFSEAIDDVNFNTKWVIDQGKISDFKVAQTEQGARITYLNESGVRRQIEFWSNDIKIDDKVKTLSTAILDTVVKSEKDSQNKINLDTNLKLLYSENIKKVSINSLKFLIFTVLFFLIPGYLISKRWLYSLPVGWSLFTFLSFILGYLKLDILIWVLPAISFVLLFKLKIKLQLKFNISLSLFLAVLSGSLYWLLTVAKSGLLYNFGYGYWGPNGHDGIWHLSLISSLQRSIPPQNPVFAGNLLTNYHYFFNLLLANTGKLFAIDSQDLLFRFFPFFIALLIGFLTYQTVKRFFVNEDWLGHISGIIAVILVYFGGSLGWILTYLQNRTFGGESTFWAQQGRSTLLNPPYAISLVLLLTGFNLFMELIKNQKEKKSYFSNFWLIISLVLTWGTLIEYKAYAGILLLGALGLLSLEKLLKKDYKFILLSGLILLTSILVFLPNNLSSSNLIVISPLWLIYSMISSADRLNWTRLALAMQSNLPFKLFVSYSIGVVVFITGNLGIRLLGFASIGQLLHKRILLYISILGLILPLVFLQKGTNWNIVQFFYYPLFIFNLLAGISLGKLFIKKSILAKAVVIIILVVTLLPANQITFAEYWPLRAPSMISNEEIAALNFLKKQPQGTVMVTGYDKKLQNKYATPIPLYAYESTAYVAAFSNQPVFLEDTVNLEIMGVDYKGRINEQNDVIQFPNKAKEIFKRNKIKYLYNIKVNGYDFNQSLMGLEKIYENGEVTIFQIL